MKPCMAAIDCRWCGRACQLRRGGSPRVFCGPACRTAFHTAARRWAEGAVAAGVLTVDHIRNDDFTPCTLQDSPGEAELLDALVFALIDLPEAEWLALIDRLPAELVERICDRIEAVARD